MKPIIQSVTLMVENMDEMKDFYQHILGFQVILQTANEVHLSANGKDVLLILEHDADALPNNRYGVGLYHIAYLLPTRSDLANVLAYFLEKRIPLQGASDHGVSEAIYLADPEGNGIEIYVDRPRSKWNWNGNQVEMITAPLDVRRVLNEATQTWSQFPDETIIGHIHLQVADIQETEKFYQEILAASTMLHFGEQALFMSRDGYHHHFGMNTWNSHDKTPLDGVHYGLKSFALLVDGKWESEMKTTSTTLTDPSGIQIQLIKG